MPPRVFSAEEIAAFRAKLAADRAALPLIVTKLQEIAGFEWHSYSAVRLASECLRALGADVPPCRSEKVRCARKEKNGGANWPYGRA